MDGLHLTADLRGCAPQRRLMTDTDALRELCCTAVRTAGLQAVGELFHQFAPTAPRRGESSTTEPGITGVVLLAESHLAVHTWPELGVVTLDVYVCNLRTDNSLRAHHLIDALAAAFSPASIERHSLRRGQQTLPPPATNHFVESP